MSNGSEELHLTCLQTPLATCPAGSIMQAGYHVVVLQLLMLMLEKASMGRSLTNILLTNVAAWLIATAVLA